MDQVITCASDLINQLLESSSKPCSDLTKSQLIETRNDLNRLLESDLSRNDWTRLFCRQLKRSMDYKQLTTENDWNEIHNDVLYILKNATDQQNIGNSGKSFFERIKFEAKLEQREIQFQETFGERKSLNEVLFEHRTFFQEYLQKCISLHSKVQVRGLVDNVDNLLRNACGTTNVLLNTRSRNDLAEKLKHIEIPLDCSTISVEYLRAKIFEYDNSSETVNNTFENFLPSAEQLTLRKFDGPIRFEDIMQFQLDRCLVILGDPGSAKTSLLRWLTHIFAEKVRDRIQQIECGKDHGTPLRVPILIRIGEFAAWLGQYPTKTLMDYIGQHTWFSKSYFSEKSRSVLRDLIYHGHALILLDGLDEISEVGRRGEIVDLVRKFIDQYVRSPSFISVFDEEMMNMQKPYDWTNEFYSIHSLKKSVGNQIIVTSRIVGYQLHSLRHRMIVHCSLSPMNNKQAKQFINQWMFQVENSVSEVLRSEVWGGFGRTMKTLSQQQDNAIKVIFENCSESLISSPSLLSLICTSMFRSSHELNFKSRIEVYDYAVQSTIHSWTREKSNISENILFNFLIDLAAYLHLQSSSGLIDAFDMEHLCCSTLKKYNLFNDRKQMHHYAKKLIHLLDFNVGIVAERGLQVFGFLHLTFQEYFVAQSLVRESSIEKIVERILSCTVNPRFRESLLLALAWISWKYSFDDYDKFCHMLVSSTEDYAIPFGILLFFDALNDLHRFPSNAVIFSALNGLLDHPSHVIAATYLIPNLFKLHENIITEWMQLHLNDEKRLFKFCEYLLTKLFQSTDKTNVISQKPILAVVCQQLWSLYNVRIPAQFSIDQTLRKIISSDNFPGGIFNDKLYADVSSQNTHPLILAVIIAVCGGVHFEKENDISKITFSPKKMHRQSSITSPIMEYLSNEKDTHSIKLQTLIKQCESILENSSPAHVSIDILDTFIALICLQGLSKPSIYQKYQGYLALSMALDRLKQIWFYLQKSFDFISQSYNKTTQSFMISQIESILNVFFSQANQSDEQHLAFSLACSSAWIKLHKDLTPNWFEFDIFHTKNIARYLECQPEFTHSIIERKIKQMTENIHPLQMFQHEPFFLLTFVPQFLQPLYYHMIVAPINLTDTVPLAVLLSHCLIFLDEVHPYNMNFYLAVSMIIPLFEEHMFENYASVLFQQHEPMSRFPNKDSDEFFKVMKDRIVTDQSKDWELLINVERERISEAKNTLQNHTKDLRLFAASICLARLFHKQYHCRHKYATENIKLSASESEEVHFAISNISDPILQITALSIVLNMKDPFIFDEEQRNQLKLKLINLLESLLPCVSLLMLTVLFVRCHMICQAFPKHFQHTVYVIGEKLNDTSINKQIEEQKAAFIALRQLNNSNLSHSLAKFAQRTENLSDLLHFNSTIFFEYFMNTTSFDSSNTTLLSSMYLTELAFDAQILKIYTNNDQVIEMTPLKKLQELWRDSSQYSEVMTFEVAIWITNYLQMSNKEELHQIIKDVTRCSKIERKALPIIETWLNYRTNKDLRLFAYYAALILVIHDSNIPNLIEIINEMFAIDDKLYLENIVQFLYWLQPANPAIIRQICVTVHENIRYSTQMSVWIQYKEMLELILSLDLERISSNIHQKSTNIITTPYLLMVSSCVEDLELYLKQYLLELVNLENNLQHNIKEEHVAVMIKWLIEMSLAPYCVKKFSIDFYEWILTFLSNQRFPRVQKAILNGLNSIFIDQHWKKEHILSGENTIIHLKKVIHSWNTYSDDVLAVCLLAYGNYILQLQKLKEDRTLSDDMQIVLTTLFETSSSELISIRAAFCLIFTHYSNIKFYTISNWFENKQGLTLKQRYNISLQSTLYKKLDLGYILDTEVIVQLIDIFVIDLYKYLCNKENIDFLADTIPNYIDVALKVCERNVDAFCNAVKNSSMGEHNFKKEYSTYFYQTKNPSVHNILVQLYVVFSGITYDLINMLTWIESIGNENEILEYRYAYVECGNGWKYLEHIKQVSDRDIIENIFEYLDSVSCNMESRCFSSILKLLIGFAETDVISLLEIHQHILPVINSLTYQNDITKWNYEANIFNLLFNFSCIRKISLPNSKEKSFTERDIDTEFETKIKFLEKNSALYLRRNYFFINFRSVSNCSK